MIGMFLGCSAEPQQSGRFAFNKGVADVPDFDVESAYQFIETQVGFGTREPNSSGHKQTRDYLISTLREFAGNNVVFAQDFQVAGYNEEILELTNVIAAFNPSARDRILLAAHWDTRPRAEEDDD
ncbi:MAG TPA: hypothetical protein DCE78_02065, partial [Bacteroidetes bacterium]|nr:hypothetical protein [Bacteroidota bacterium]